MTVYVVDDQLAIVEMLALLLSELGVEANGTTVSSEAHQAIAALQPDLVLLDLMMPAPDGLAVLDTLKNDPRTAHIPVVLCTASILSPSQSLLFSDKSIGVLSKPFDLEQLRDIVDEVARSQ